MTVSFKQFAAFLTAAEGELAPDKLDEIWSSIFAKKKEEEDKEARSGLLTAKERLEKKKKEAKEKEEERKKELEKKRNQAWLDAKDRAEGRKTEPARSERTISSINRDEYALQRTMREGKDAYSSEGDWKRAAKEAGYVVKKVSGNLMDGDQTWCAYDDDDKKVGEFTEKEEGRGGWLRT